MTMSRVGHISFFRIHIPILMQHDLINFIHRFWQLCKIATSNYIYFSIIHTNLDSLEVVWKVKVTLNSIYRNTHISCVEKIELFGILFHYVNLQRVHIIYIYYFYSIHSLRSGLRLISLFSYIRTICHML